MTNYQRDALYALVHSNAWQHYLTYKMERLAQMHSDLEWQRDFQADETKGAIKEIRADLGLAAMLERA
jgi:hypothetical protein